jgi:pantoate--beta-alanine ligase
VSEPAVLHSVAAFRQALETARAGGRSVGLVPTMGALHAGHESLIRRAVAECDTVGVSIFVNPLQFGNAADLDRYPRTLAGDVEICAALGVGVVFAPGVTEMYPGWPEPPATLVSVGSEASGWEGASRPGHFEGVATVVAKLFAIAGRCRAYFGEKDFQQLAVVRRMAADLSFPVEVVACPTVREPDGLACSSRNARLSPEARRAATVLWRALSLARVAVAAGERRPRAIGALIAEVVAAEPSVTLDYGAVVDAETLRIPDRLDGRRPLQLLVAAEVGGVRLIDNAPVEVAHRALGPEAALVGAARSGA